MLFGKDVARTSEEEAVAIRHRYGVLFQNGALFSSLTVGENVAVPLVEQTDLPKDVVEHIVELRLLLTGLSPETAEKMPSELSGGMRKRVALARALALEPEMLFLDEPTSGLDPINARAFDSLIKTLSDNLGLTVFMVTHDLDSICSIADRVIVLGGGKLIGDGTVDEIMQIKHEWIQDYFNSRAAPGVLVDSQY
jgi:phospholipid/cholesterol/gamma-HCH transport system ATP-binding protein